MDANLTKYDCETEGSNYTGCYGVMRQSDDGEYVKFADVKGPLSKSHNSASFCESRYCKEILQCSITR